MLRSIRNGAHDRTGCAGGAITIDRLAGVAHAAADGDALQCSLGELIIRYEIQLVLHLSECGPSIGERKVGERPDIERRELRGDGADASAEGQCRIGRPSRAPKSDVSKILLPDVGLGGLRLAVIEEYPPIRRGVGREFHLVALSAVVKGPAGAALHGAARNFSGQSEGAPDRVDRRRNVSEIKIPIGAGLKILGRDKQPVLEQIQFKSDVLALAFRGGRTGERGHI